MPITPQIELIMTIDSAMYDNGNNDKCGAPFSWVSDRSGFANNGASRDTVVPKHFHCRQMNERVAQRSAREKSEINRSPIYSMARYEISHLNIRFLRIRERCGTTAGNYNASRSLCPPRGPETFARPILLTLISILAPRTFPREHISGASVV